MRALLFIWLFVLVGAGIGVVLTQDSGYVLLSFGRYTIETSLALLVLFLAAVFGALYFSIRLLIRTLHLPTDHADYAPKIKRMIEIAWDEVPRIALWQPALNVATQSLDGYEFWFHRQLDARGLRRT